jgi:hypothetical protein
MSNYYLCDFFVEILDNKKIEKSDGVDDDVCTSWISRDMLRTYSGL